MQGIALLLALGVRKQFWIVNCGRTDASAVINVPNAALTFVSFAHYHNPAISGTLQGLGLAAVTASCLSDRYATATARSWAFRSGT
jgi:hypothetical protein